MRYLATLLLVTLPLAAQTVEIEAVAPTTAWSNVPLPERALGITAHADALWVVGSGEFIAVSRDGAKTWQTVHRAPDGATLYTLVFLDPQNAVALGEQQAFLVSHDGGATWRNTHQGPGDPVFQAAFGDPTHVVADSGFNFLVSDDLKKWFSAGSAQLTQNGSLQRIVAVAALDAQRFAVLFDKLSRDQAQYLAHSADGGRHWGVTGFPHVHLDSLVA